MGSDQVTGAQVAVEPGSIPGPYGMIPVRIYRPNHVSARGGLVWLHGGAFIGGTLDMAESDWVANQVADAGVTVVTVDYRLAPTPDWMAPHAGPNPTGWHFPVASEEVTTAFTWATRLKEGIPAERWAIGGASAGGNLAAGAAMRLRDAGGVTPHALVLAYPLLHKELPTMSAELQAKYDRLPVQARFSTETVSMINLNYVGDAALLDNAYAFPGGHDLGGLPPTFIVNSDVDSLRASGELFASELTAAGVDTTVVREIDTEHGHLDQPDNSGAELSVRRIVQWLTLMQFTASAPDEAELLQRFGPQ